MALYLRYLLLNAFRYDCEELYFSDANNVDETPKVVSSLGTGYRKVFSLGRMEDCSGFSSRKEYCTRDCNARRVMSPSLSQRYLS